jgi:hypothetical protein
MEFFVGGSSGNPKSYLGSKNWNDLVIGRSTDPTEVRELHHLTSCWVYVKLDCKVLKQASKSWLQVWAMMMMEPKRGGWGQKHLMKNDKYECDKGKEINPMEHVSNNGATKFKIVFFFYTWSYTPV